jgi:hypothetical protein
MVSEGIKPATAAVKSEICGIKKAAAADVPIESATTIAAVSIVFFFVVTLEILVGLTPNYRLLPKTRRVFNESLDGIF